MRFTERHTLGIAIGVVLLLLGIGIWQVIDSLQYASPFGYGASGIGIVVGAAGMGALFVLLLLLLIALFRTPGQLDTDHSVTLVKPSLWKSSALMVLFGWAGMFWTVVSIARGWYWIDILLGMVAILVACATAFRISQVRQAR